MSSKECSDLEEIDRVLQGLSSSSEKSKEEGNRNVAISIPAKVDDGEDEVIIVQSNIYKYHGEDKDSSIDHQVSEGILKFDYRDEEDDDIIEMFTVEKRKDDSFITVDVDENKTYLDDVGKMKDKEETCEQETREEKQEFEKPATRNRNIKTFENGNFFMFAD